MGIYLGFDFKYKGMVEIHVSVLEVEFLGFVFSIGSFMLLNLITHVFAWISMVWEFLGYGLARLYNGLKNLCENIKKSYEILIKLVVLIFTSNLITKY